MNQKRSRGRLMKSDKIIIKAVPLDEVDVRKMAQALISIANNIAKKGPALSRPEDE